MCLFVNPLCVCKGMCSWHCRFIPSIKVGSLIFDIVPNCHYGICTHARTGGRQAVTIVATRKGIEKYDKNLSRTIQR